MWIDRNQFIKDTLADAQAAVKGSGLYVGTLLSQAILESSGNYNGQWQVGGSTLAREANNYFGIKASPSWNGDTYTIQTKEYDSNGNPYMTTADFRKYDNIGESFKDYVSFLVNNPRYKAAGVFSAKNVQEQAAALQKAGYSTSPSYATTVTSIYDKAKNLITENPKTAIGLTGGLLITFSIGMFLLYKK
jgi:peptidoglycan hydrolase FlgJ